MALVFEHGQSSGGAVTGEVVGGSGAYEGANGSFTSSGGENAVDNFHIVTFSS